MQQSKCGTKTTSNIQQVIGLCPDGLEDVCCSSAKLGVCLLAKPAFQLLSLSLAILGVIAEGGVFTVKPMPIGHRQLLARLGPAITKGLG